MAPEMQPASSKSTRMNLPKRDEFGFITVVALPNASKTGVESSTVCAIGELSVPSLLARQPRYLRRYLFASVLPAPDSPVMRVHCPLLELRPRHRGRGLCEAGG